VLADCGYVDREVFERLAEQRPQMDLYVSVHREDAHAERRYDYRPPERIKPPKKITDPVLLAMAEKLKTEEGRAIYGKRACTAEPTFGIIKQGMGFRQFLLRGLKKVSGEWNLVCLAYNLKRLHTLSQAVVKGGKGSGRGCFSTKVQLHLHPRPGEIKNPIWPLRRSPPVSREIICRNDFRAGPEFLTQVRQKRQRRDEFSIE